MNEDKRWIYQKQAILILKCGQKVNVAKEDLIYSNEHNPELISSLTKEYKQEITKKLNKSRKWFHMNNGQYLKSEIVGFRTMIEFTINIFYRKPKKKPKKNCYERFKEWFK